MNNIYHYTDYRTFLKHAYQERKMREKRFSYQRIAEYVGFKSKSQFPQVLSGKLRLRGDQVWKIAELFKLDKQESEYLELMVRFCDADTLTERTRHYERMMSYNNSVVTALDREQFEFYEKWYYPAIWNILHFYPFRGDYNRLARMVHPAISISEARRAIKVLLRLNLISRSEDGCYICNAPLLQASTPGYSLALANYASQMIEQAQTAINKTPKSERSISCSGLSISADAFEQIQEETRNFRRRILNIAANCENPDRAYHFNIQIFPISKPYNSEDQS